jgi:hypothetical protein
MAIKGKLMALAHLPADGELLAAVGRVSIRHSFLDWTLNRTIKTLTSMTPEQADFAFAREGSASLRRKVLMVAEQKCGKKSDTFRRIKVLMKACEDATRLRNDLVHCVWANIEGSAVLLDLQAKDKRMPLPTARQLNDLAERIHQLSAELNEARMKGGGFIFEAMKAVKDEKRRLTEDQAKAKI